MDAVEFTLNGRPVRATGRDPHTTLLEYVRALGLVGAKEGCAEGECGACALVFEVEDPEAPAPYEAVNSCLVLLPSVHGRSVWTVEALARDGRLHPVQRALIERGGSQCGYCTPGFVMSMFAEYYRADGDFDLDVLGGNLCRCTGYRPIRDAARALGKPAPDDPFLRRGANGTPSEAPVVRSGGARFYRPGSLKEAVEILAGEPDAAVVAGGTDLVVERNIARRRRPAYVSVEKVPELRRFHWGDDAVEIGAGLPLTTVERLVEGRLPLLEQLMPLFASRLIRNRATLGGNLATASPIGDAAPCLLALDARVRIAGAAGERTLPLTSFFTGYRQTALEAGEVLVSVLIPRPFPEAARFYKVAKRDRDDISIVAAAFAADRGEGGRFARVRIAYGGVAPTPVRIGEAERALEGRTPDAAALKAAGVALAEAVQPISDHRGSAAYRRALVVNLLERFYYETVGVTTWA